MPIKCTVYPYLITLIYHPITYTSCSILYLFLPCTHTTYLYNVHFTHHLPSIYLTTIRTHLYTYTQIQNQYEDIRKSKIAYQKRLDKYNKIIQDIESIYLVTTTNTPSSLLEAGSVSAVSGSAGGGGGTGGGYQGNSSAMSTNGAEKSDTPGFVNRSISKVKVRIECTI